MLSVRPRTAAYATALGFPAALVAWRITHEPWAMPTTVSAISIGGTLWAHRQTRLPTPAPPDSMRTWYGLEDVFVWSRYQAGYRDAIEHQRSAEFRRARQSSVMLVLIANLTFLALRLDR